MVGLVGCLRLMVVIFDVTTVSNTVKLCIKGVHLVTIMKIVSPLAVVEMLEWSGFHVVPLKVHEHGWDTCSVVVPRVKVCDQMASSH